MNRAREGLNRSRLVASSVVYVVAVFGTSGLVENSVPGVGQILLALIPLAPALFMVYYAVEAVRAADELERRIHLEGLAFGFVGAGVTVVTVALLQTAGFPDLRWIWVWTVMMVFWVAGLFLAFFRYR